MKGLGIVHTLRLTCRCWISVDRDALVNIVPGAQARCPNHGLHTLISLVPRLEPWEMKFRTPSTRRW